jgi:hypothetical protein
MCKISFAVGIFVTLLSAVQTAPGATRQKSLPAYPPSVNTSAAVADAKKVAKSRSDLSRAQDTLNAMMDRLMSRFEQTVERRETVATLQKVRAEYDAARDRVVHNVQDGMAYKAAVEQRDQLGASLAKSGDNDSDSVQGAAKKMEASRQVTRIEADGLSGDPTFVAAQSKLTEVGTKMSAQLTAFRQSVTSDQAWITAKDVLDKAKAEVDVNEKEFSAEVAREEQLQRDRAAQVAQIDRQRLEQSAAAGKKSRPRHR